MLPGEDRAARRVLLVCLAAGATTLLDRAVLNFAVPSMRRSLRAGAGNVQWIVAGYSLAFGLALVPGGCLGDAHGCKRFFLAGVAVFLRAGVTAASGGGPGALIAARLVQGAAAGLVNSQVIGTLQDVLRCRRRPGRVGGRAHRAVCGAPVCVRRRAGADRRRLGTYGLARPDPGPAPRTRRSGRSGRRHPADGAADRGSGLPQRDPGGLSPLRAAAPEGNGARSAYALASCVCTGLLAVALVLSRRRGAALKEDLYSGPEEHEPATRRGDLLPYTATGRLPADPPSPEQ